LDVRRLVPVATGDRPEPALIVNVKPATVSPASFLTWRRIDHSRTQRAVALAMFEYGDLPASLDADSR